ncbi:hypothetical protein QIG69_27370, partial [Klebsiella pneumoniae]|nr:hypothetical protein [Klebsiella pneumoniae]
CPTAKTARYTLIVDETAAVETLSAFAIEGRDGSRMFVAKDPTAASAASTLMRASDEVLRVEVNSSPPIFRIVI